MRAAGQGWAEKIGTGGLALGIGSGFAAGVGVPPVLPTEPPGPKLRIRYGVRGAGTNLLRSFRLPQGLGLFFS